MLSTNYSHQGLSTRSTFTPGTRWQTIENDILKLTSIKSSLLYFQISLIELNEKENDPKILVERVKFIQNARLEFKRITPFFPFKEIKGLEFLSDKSVNAYTADLYAYALPDMNSIQSVETFFLENGLSKNNKEILDYGAKLALWSRLFLENGFHVKAIDCEETAESWILEENWTFLTDLNREVEYVKHRMDCGLPEYCDQTVLFLCWPENPKNESDSPPYAARILEEFRKRGGEFAIYIGEEKKGITATDSFFEEMDTHWSFRIVGAQEKAVQSLRPSDQNTSMWLLKKKNSDTYSSFRCYLPGVLLTAVFASAIFWSQRR